MPQCANLPAGVLMHLNVEAAIFLRKKSSKNDHNAISPTFMPQLNSMNRYCVSDILLKSISCYYLLLDTQLNIKATNIDSAFHFPEIEFEIETPFPTYFDKDCQEKFNAAFEKLEYKKETTQVVIVPADSQRNIDIEWNICSVWDGESLAGFELLVVHPPSPTIQKTPQTTEGA